MKLGRQPLLAVALLGVVCAVGSALRAQDDGQGPGPGGPGGTNQPGGPGDNPPPQRGRGGPGGGRINLGREMGALSTDYKKNKASISDSSKNAATVLTVIDMEQHTANCKTAPPRTATATTMPGDASKLTDYQTIMSNLLRGELDLEEQLRDNQNDKAAETFKSLAQFEDEGHKEFRKKEDD